MQHYLPQTTIKDEPSNLPVVVARLDKRIAKRTQKKVLYVVWLKDAAYMVNTNKQIIKKLHLNIKKFKL